MIELEGAPLTVEVAVSAPRRARGLGGVERLASDRGMLFVHRQSGRQTYWMKDMRFAIDVIWCQGERVVEVTPAVPAPAPGSTPAEPPKVRSRHDADAVIEVPAGWAEAHGVRAGSTLRIV